MTENERLLIKYALGLVKIKSKNKLRNKNLSDIERERHELQYNFSVKLIAKI